jgi:hypothetical protein
VLEDPTVAEDRAARGYSDALARHDLDRYVKEISTALRSLV